VPDTLTRHGILIMGEDELRDTALALLAHIDALTAERDALAEDEQAASDRLDALTAAVDAVLDIGQDEDGSWHVSIRAMPGHVGAAETLQQAGIEAAEAAELWIAVAREPHDA
jgi:predicted RNase H-like HicB family nuclease